MSLSFENSNLLFQIKHKIFCDELKQIKKLPDMENNGFDQQTHDEILLDPDKLAKLLYNEDDNHFKEDTKLVRDNVDVPKDNDLRTDGMYTSIRDSDDYESLTSDLTNKIQKVLPAIEQAVIDEEKAELNEVATNKNKLPPVTLQKVQSEDLSWLDTIIKHNSIDYDHLQDVNLG